MRSLGKVLKKILWIILIIIFVIGLALIVFFTLIDIFDEDDTSLPNMGAELIDKSKKDSALMKAASSDHDTTIQVIRVSNKLDLNIPYSIDEEAGRVKRVFTGRRINIAVIGVDSRLGTAYKHADANHVISILIDEGKIEITSIPRDTPCDAGLEDTLQNKLTVLYPARGRKVYLDTVAKIAELDKIHYFIEVGFSQARGILELFGYDDSGSALQVLRSRTALGGNDFQRVYTQAQFMRQNLLKHFDKLTGFFSEILIRGGLALLETNITYPVAENILTHLKNHGFPKSPDDIVVRIRPAMNMSYKVFNLADKNSMNELSGKVEDYNINNSSTLSHNISADDRISKMLWNKISTAIADSSSKPQKVIADLKTLFNQRSWLQVNNKNEREKIREEFGNLLIGAYNKRKQYDKAEEIKRAIESEKKLFSLPVFENSNKQ